MKWLRLVPVVGLAAACGGSASLDRNGASNPAGAGGNPSNDSGGASGAAPAHGGTGVGVAGSGVAGSGIAGSGAGAPGEAGASAAGAGGATAEGGAAGQTSPGCEGLACLAGAELVYWPDREWQRTTSAGPSEELLEADYLPKEGGSAWDVKISSDAQQITLTPRAGGNAVDGTRDVQRTDRAWFNVTLAVSGRFVVKGAPPQFQAELTAYGSGIPILYSTRGVLKAP